MLSKAAILLNQKPDKTFRCFVNDLQNAPRRGLDKWAAVVKGSDFVGVFAIALLPVLTISGFCLKQ
jgi:hypothetical protein